MVVAVTRSSHVCFAAYSLNVKPLLKLACSSVFGSANGFTDMLVRHIPSPREGAPTKVDLQICFPNPVAILHVLPVAVSQAGGRRYSILTTSSSILFSCSFLFF